MKPPITVYRYRDPHFAPAGNTEVSGAALDDVIAVYQSEERFTDAFGGSITYKDDASGMVYLGVWGVRAASRFRAALRLSGSVVIRDEVPPARLAHYTKRPSRP